MVTSLRVPSASTVSRLLAALAVLTTGVAATYLLSRTGDVFFAAWVLFAVLLSVVGGFATWTDRTPVVWVAALLLTGLSIVGMWSIGPFVAPAALFLLGAAILLQSAGPRTGVREAVVADPPTVPEAVLKTLAGTGSLVVGVALVYASAIAGELFGACARETLACAIEKTHWDVVGMTVLGLVAVVLGGWLIWKQVYVARVLASTGAG